MDKIELPELPSSLLEMVGMKATPAPANLRAGLDHIPEGARNETLFRLASRLRGEGNDPPSIAVALKRTNELRCRPALSEEEVIAIAASVARYPAGKPRGRARVTKLTDVGNAKRLVELHGSDFRFCNSWKAWVVWTGKNWQRDGSGEMIRLAEATLSQMGSEAARSRSAIRRAELLNHALKSEHISRLKAMIDLARSEPGVTVSPSKFDAEPMLLNLENGTLDLESGRLREHRREDFLTRLVPITHDNFAVPTAWLQFIDEVTRGRVELVRFLQEVVGYWLTGRTDEQAVFLLHGSGANGKTTFVETVKGLLGDYATVADFDMLAARTWAGGVRNDIARLAGARLVAATEPELGHRLSDVVLKRLTGQDTITARFLYQEAFEFRPAFKICIATNHLPTIGGSDSATWRRIRLIPFDFTIPVKERDPRLPERLRLELPGILNWAVEGCLRWQTSRLSEPAEIADAISRYRDGMDSLSACMTVVFVSDPVAATPFKDLRWRYENWCSETGRVPLNQKAFAIALTSHGFRHKAGTRGRRLRTGIRLREPTDD